MKVFKYLRSLRGHLLITPPPSLPLIIISLINPYILVLQWLASFECMHG